MSARHLRSHPRPTMDVAAFERDGYVVVPDVLTASEVADARQGLRASADARALAPRWKMRVHFRPRVVQTYSDLYRQTFGTQQGVYAHRHGPTSAPTAMPLIDSRFSEKEECFGVRASVTAADSDRPRCWQPISSLVCLTDVGLEADAPFAASGSMILWDTRVPCAATHFLKDGRASEVLHVGYLPNVAANRRYSALIQMPQLAQARDRDWEMSDMMAGFP